MSTPKHTSAPWRIDEHLYASDGAIWGPDGMTVCHVTDRGGETRDNAHLIEAAPDLLAALRDVIRWVPGREQWHTDEPIKAVERARAAIEKAEQN